MDCCRSRDSSLFLSERRAAAIEGYEEMRAEGGSEKLIESMGLVNLNTRLSRPG